MVEKFIIEGWRLLKMYWNVALFQTWNIVLSVNYTRRQEAHIFFDCFIAKSLIILIAKWWNIPHTGNMMESIFSWGEANNLKGDRLHIFKVIILTYFWQIWKTRNEMVHDKNRLSLERMFILIQRLTFFWVNSKKKLKRSLDWGSWVCSPSSCL